MDQTLYEILVLNRSQDRVQLLLDGIEPVPEIGVKRSLICVRASCCSPLPGFAGPSLGLFDWDAPEM